MSVAFDRNSAPLSSPKSIPTPCETELNISSFFV